MRFSIAGDPLIDLFVTGAGPIAAPITQSVTEPASSGAALAVGAVCWQTGDLEWYSSEGPTIDGRTKPDITAFDSVSTDMYGAATSGGPGADHRGSPGLPPRRRRSRARRLCSGAFARVDAGGPDLALETRAQGLEESNSSAGDNDQTGHGPLAFRTDSIGAIAFDYSGGAFVTDGDAVRQVTDYSPRLVAGRHHSPRKAVIGRLISHPFTPTASIQDST